MGTGSVRVTDAAAAAAQRVFGKVRRLLHAFERERRDTPPYQAKWVFNVRVEADELDGGFIAEVIELPGCVSQGETEREALENLVDAIGSVLTTRMHAQVDELPVVQDHGKKLQLAVGAC